jgi:hypothetical protein
MDAPNGGAGVLISSRGYRAGIEHNEVRFLRGASRRQPTRGQLALNGGAIGLCGAAAEALYKKSGHDQYYNSDVQNVRFQQQLTTKGVAAGISQR